MEKGDQALYDDILDKRLLQIYMNSFDSGTAEHVEQKIDAMKESMGEDNAPLYDGLKKQLGG